MGTITFSPPATREQFFRARDTLASAGGFFQWSGDTVVSMKAFEFPCDLTVDPTKPDTWVRAVYEAGKRDGVVEHVLVFGGPSPAHPSVEAKYGKGYVEGVMGGASQQPASKPSREQPAKVPVCKLCERHLWDGPMSMVDGWAFCSHGCADTYYQSLQPQWKPSEKIDLNGVEYVPKVTPPA